MSVPAAETYEMRTPDAEGWRGIPFQHPRGLTGTAVADGGQHDGGPMPPEAPRDPEPGGEGQDDT